MSALVVVSVLDANRSAMVSAALSKRFCHSLPSRVNVMVSAVVSAESWAIAVTLAGFWLMVAVIQYRYELAIDAISVCISFRYAVSIPAFGLMAWTLMGLPVGLLSFMSKL